MSLRIIKSGMLDSLQDLGRRGFSGWGVNPGGAMDRVAAQLASILAGNARTSAVLELHFPAAQIEFTSSHLICITGADFDPTIDGVSLPLWTPVLVKPGMVLTFRKQKRGMRAYLSIHGGFEISSVMGSFSTNLKASFGGYEGRKLMRGDVIDVRPGSYLKTVKRDGFHRLPWKVDWKSLYPKELLFRFVVGGEWSWLTKDARQELEFNVFTIDRSSDRMVYNLIHDPLPLERKDSLISSAVTFGTLQVMPQGRLAVLMADHQTTGGYPRIGHIITADLYRIAQLQPGDTFKLKCTTTDAAEKLLLSQKVNIDLIEMQCQYNLEKFYRSQL